MEEQCQCLLGESAEPLHSLSGVLAVGNLVGYRPQRVHLWDLG